MRLQIYLPEYYKKINIQEIRGIFDEEPRMLFICDKKYEMAVFNSPAIFRDQKGKEYFRTDRLLPYMRLYEADGHRPKVMLEVRDMYVEGVGPISNHYLEKVLSDCCNCKSLPIRRPPAPPPTRHERLQRLYRRSRAALYFSRHLIWREERQYHFHNLNIKTTPLILPEDIIPRIISRAPT